jgi:hypothetical protein
MRLKLVAASCMLPVVLAMTPAEATVTNRVDSAPAWVHKSSSQTFYVGKTALPAVYYTTDWSWWKGGWTVKFNWRETKKMSYGFAYCMTVATTVSLLAGRLGTVIGASCGFLWLYAEYVKSRGDCVKVFVPVSLYQVTAGKWDCPH